MLHAFQQDIGEKMVVIRNIARGEKVFEILNIISYFSFENIPTKMFIDVVKGTKELESTLELLKQYSLVDLSEDLTVLNISKPTQHFIRNVLKEENKEKVTLSKALKLFRTELEPSNLNHAVSTWNYASTYQELVNEYSILPCNIVQKLVESCRYEEAYLFGMEHLKMIECLNSENGLYLRYKIGNVLLKQSKFEEALKVYEDPRHLYKDIKLFLRYAAEDGNFEAVKFLIENKGIDNKIYRRKSILCCAIQGNNFEVIKFLVEEKKVDIHLANICGVNAIHYASQQGNLDVVKFLVEKGADINSTDNSRRNSVHYAAKQCHLAVIKFLVENGVDFKSGDDDEYRKTPLHYAAEKGSLDIVKFLLENETDVDATDRYSKTSLHYAAIKGNLDIVKFLLKNNADIDATDRDSKTSLHWAAYMGNLNILRFLIKKGANINAMDRKHMTPLDYAIEKIDPVTPIDYRGSTQLHYAVYFGYTQLVQNLLKSVDNNLMHDFILHKTNGGNTAIDLAIKMGNKDIIKMLDQALQKAP